ncbi:MAG TPA: helix-turn-helix transcriptional regulator [Vicinamibacterales bacterium]|nr:helix-turn-helix transcriptional regulator [Vicinamibacterales bacterium]
MEFDRELLKGSIGLLILRLLSLRDMYGYEIILEAGRRSDQAFQFKEGTLYPALHHLERQGHLRSDWRIGDNGRRRKYYGLTAKGRKIAERRQRDWVHFTRAINAVLTGELS